MRTFVLTLAMSASLFLLVGDASAQARIGSNDPVAGRITKAKEIHSWEVEVADLGVIEFEVECDTAALYAQVIRVADSQPMPLDPIQGTNASYFNGGKNVVKASNAAVPKRGPFSARTSTRLAGGKYRIIVGSPGPGEFGPYQLTVASPKIKAAVEGPNSNISQPGIGTANKPDSIPADNTKAFQEILEQLKKLNDRVEKLELQAPRK
jgi:hypothetical protein